MDFDAEADDPIGQGWSGFACVVVHGGMVWREWVNGELTGSVRRMLGQAVLTQMPVLTGVEAVAPSRVILIDASGMRGLLPDEPTLSTALLMAEAMDFRSLVLQVCDLKLRTTAQRLGYYLLELAPDKSSQSATLRLPFDKRLLAARLGCRQENLSRAFATLRGQGVETRCR